MVLSFKTGNFNKQTTTGNQVITGVGFQPKGIILWGISDGALNTFMSQLGFFIGFAADTTAANQRSMSVWSSDGGTSDIDANWHLSSIWTDNNGTSLVDQGAISAVSTDGFTVNWSLNGFNARHIMYACIGGADITNTKVGHFLTPGVTGNSSVTGIGFKPDYVIMFFPNQTSDNVVNAVGSYGMGCFNTQGEQATFACMTMHNASPTDTARYQRTNKCLALFSSTSSTTLTHEATVVSMDVDGFTLNYTTASVANKRVAYMAIKGGKCKISSFTSPITGAVPVSQSTTTVGFQPRGMMYMTVGNVASTAINTHDRFCVGAANSSTNESLAWAGDQDAATGSTVAAIKNDNACIRISDEAATASSTTTQGLADFSAFVSNGFTLSWSTHDTNAYEIIYLAFGDAGTLVTRSVTEAVTVVANVARKRKGFVPITAALTITANTVKIASIRKTAPAALTINAATTVRRRIPRTFSESLTISANVTRFLRSIEVCSASLIIAASLVRTFKLRRSVDETVLIAANTLVGEHYPRFVNDSLTIAANAVRQYRPIKSIAEAFSIVANVAKKAIQRRNLFENPTIVAIGNSTAKIKRSVAESFSLVGSGFGVRLTLHVRSVFASLAIVEDGVVEFCTTTGQLAEIIHHKLGRYWSVLPQRNIRAYVWDSVFFKRKERET